MNAVITADVVNSTQLSVEAENQVIRTIYENFSNDTTIRTNVDNHHSVIKRGDTIQLEVNEASEALRIAMLLKTALNKITLLKNRKPSIDVRIAIGIGDINVQRTSVDESTGEAYTYSGRTLDSMKKNKRKLAIKTHSDGIDAELETAFRLLEVIMSGWVVTSAEVVYWTLKGLNEKEISEKLGVTQSAINQRKKTAGWSGIEALLKRFEQLINMEA